MEETEEWTAPEECSLTYPLTFTPVINRLMVEHAVSYTLTSDNLCVVVVVDLPLLRVAVEGSDNPVSLEKPCQASLPPDQQGRHSLGRQPEVQFVA